MAEIVYDPLETYRDEFLPAFRKNLDEAFGELVRESQVDTDANAALCAEIEALEQECGSLSDQISNKRLVRNLLVIFGVIASPMPLYINWLCDTFGWGMLPSDRTMLSVMLCILGIVALIIAFTTIRKKIDVLLEEYNNQNDILGKKNGEAWAQTVPLRALFTWTTTLELIQKTVPILQFDKYFSLARYNELNEDFGSLAFLEKENESTLGIQSGNINGNPFAFVHRKVFQWGRKTYYGYKTIHWTERVRGSDGKMRTVSRSETLQASVTKPFPTYSQKTMLVYGNDAAPNLQFTKEISSLNDPNSSFKSMRKSFAKRKLKKFSRNLTDDSDYTMMSNEEFEVLFNTANRNNETEFRLLFTPMAQRQMLALLEDSSVGYGDDFMFIKRNKINVVMPKHLVDASLYINPIVFADRKVEEIGRKFKAISENYFRKLYFAFAPLLSIPLYQQMKSQRTIWGDVIYRKAAKWEWEVTANYRGSNDFDSNDCVTDSILKTSFGRQVDGQTTEVTVESKGYYAKRRADYESVYGGDGNWHRVRVDWDEYLPANKTTKMHIQECEENSAEKVVGYDKQFRNIRSRIVH